MISRCMSLALSATNASQCESMQILFHRVRNRRKDHQSRWCRCIQNVFQLLDEQRMAHVIHSCALVSRAKKEPTCRKCSRIHPQWLRRICSICQHCIQARRGVGIAPDTSETKKEAIYSEFLAKLKNRAERRKIEVDVVTSCAKSVLMAGGQLPSTPSNAARVFSSLRQARTTVAPCHVRMDVSLLEQSDVHLSGKRLARFQADSF
jgi:hypothetical protein